jgi:hypothetical protein
MNLPDAPIAHEGFFATHFFTVKDQETSKTTPRKLPSDFTPNVR